MNFIGRIASVEDYSGADTVEVSLRVLHNGCAVGNGEEGQGIAVGAQFLVELVEYLQLAFCVASVCLVGLGKMGDDSLHIQTVKAEDFADLIFSGNDVFHVSQDEAYTAHSCVQSQHYTNILVQLLSFLGKGEGVIVTAYNRNQLFVYHDFVT